MSPARKYLSRDVCKNAIANTNSAKAAARYLGVDYYTFRSYSKLYKSDDGTQTLFESCKNPAAKGIPKFKKDGKKIPLLLDIIEGRVGVESYDPNKIKYRLIAEGWIKEECALCGFHERRVIDYRMPLLLHHKDNNKKNFKLDNIELLCYNCFYLFQGNLFNNKDIEHIETNLQVFGTTEAINWELDDYHLQRLKELGLDNEIEDDPNEFVSRK